MNTDNLCMGCMHELGREKQCPHCGFQADSLQVKPYLPIRTVVGGRYIIGKLLEYNGEGASYIAFDTTAQKAVCVREYFPLGLVKRGINDVDVIPLSGNETVYAECGQSFLDLWNKLGRLSGAAGIVRVFQVLKDYGTVYAVYENIEGITLREFLLGSRTGYISWDKARQLLMPVLSALGTLHSNGIIHRGISPLTLIIGGDGKMRITGFCIPQVRTARSDLQAQLFPGYAAIEQYGYKGQQGPWTDIYAFGAVLYRSLIGTDPIEATTRVTNDRLMVPGKFAEQLPAYVINGLVNSLQILPEDRTRTVEQLHAEITASPAAAIVEESYVERRTAQPERTRQPAPAPADRNRKNTAGLSTAIKSAVLCVVVGLIAFVLVSVTILPDEYNVFKGIGFGANSTEVATENQEMVNVPDFRTKSYAEVIASDYNKSHFTFTKTEVNSDEIEMGYIIEQDVEPGKEVPSGTTIRLTVSKGTEKIILPNVLGQNYDDVYTMLTEMGFVVSKSERANDGSHPAGEIIQMSKTPEVQYEKGERVTLQVYEEPATEPPTTTTTTTTTTTLPPETDVETVVHDPLYNVDEP